MNRRTGESGNGGWLLNRICSSKSRLSCAFWHLLYGIEYGQPDNEPWRTFWKVLNEQPE